MQQDTAESAEAAPWTLYRPAERGWMLFVLLLVGTLTFIDRNIVSILIEPLKREFGLSDTQVGLLTGLGFALLYAVLGLPISNYADRANRKRLIVISLTVWSLLTALTGMAQSFWQLIACRMGVGAAESGSLPASQSLIADYFPPSDRGKALGVYTLSTGIAFVVALGGGGWVAENYGWRAALIACGLLGVPVALLCLLVLKEPRHRIGFGKVEQSREPLFESLGKLLAKRAYLYLLGGMVIYFSVAQGALIFMPSYLIRFHKMSVAEVGLIYSVVATVAAIAGTLIGGYMTDWLSRKAVGWSARIPALAMLICLPIFELALSLRSVPLTLAVLTCGQALVASMLPAMFAAIHTVCGDARRALAIAVALAVGNLLGQSMGPFLTGALSDALAAGGDTAEGLRRALAIVMLLLLPGGWFLLRASHHAARDFEE